MPLKVSDGMGAWIDDFKKSDAPQFKGKSAKERRDQAIAAYLSAKRDQKEATGEQPPFEGPYLKKKVATPGKQGYGPSAAKHLAKMGLKKQLDKKPVKESTAAYAASLEKEKEKRLTTNDQDKLARLRRMMDREKTKVTREPKGEYDRKVTGYLKKKYNKEEVELGEETTFEVEVEGLPTMYVKAKSPGEVKANLRKIVKQPSMITGVSRVTDAEMKKVFRDKAQGREKDDDDLDEAIKKDKREEIAEDMKSAAAELSKYANAYGGMDKADFQKAAKHMKAGDHKSLHKQISKLDTDPRDKILTTLHKHGNDIKRYGYATEEVEQIDELSKSTLRSYIDKKSDDHESNRNAVADARDALRKHQRNKPSLDAPLKHQFDHDAKKRELERDVNAASRTATRSNVNILKAKKRLNKEEVEQVDELSQNTLRQYHGKSALDIRKKRDQLNKGTLSTADHKKAQRRVTGINRAANKMEEVEEGTGSLKPGWMLKADPKLGAAVKAKQDLAKKRQATYGDKSAGQSVMDKLRKEKASMCEQCGKVHEGKCS